MDHSIKECLKIMKWMDMDNIHGQEKILIKEILKMIKWMVMENIHGKIV